MALAELIVQEIYITNKPLITLVNVNPELKRIIQSHLQKGGTAAGLGFI